MASSPPHLLTSSPRPSPPGEEREKTFAGFMARPSGAWILITSLPRRRGRDLRWCGNAKERMRARLAVEQGELIQEEHEASPDNGPCACIYVGAGVLDSGRWRCRLAAASSQRHAHRPDHG